MVTLLRLLLTRLYFQVIIRRVLPKGLYLMMTMDSHLLTWLYLMMAIASHLPTRLSRVKILSRPPPARSSLKRTLLQKLKGVQIGSVPVPRLLSQIRATHWWTEASRVLQMTRRPPSKVLVSG